MNQDQKKILIVDDEPDILQLLEISLNRMGLAVFKAGNVGSAKYLLKKYTFHLCLTDFKLPDGTGMDLVEHMVAEYPETPVAVITAFGTINYAVEAVKKGAVDFISKPISLEKLRQLVVDALKKADRQNLPEDFKPQLFSSKAKYFAEINQFIEDFAEHDGSPLILYGADGTWKQKIAAMIHANSNLREQPFQVIKPDQENIAELIQKSKGTLYFSDVERLDSSLQSLLSEQIKQKQPWQRIIAATSWGRQELSNSLVIQDQLLRQLCVGELKLKPLQFCKEELTEISNNILLELSKEWNKLPCKLHPSAIKKLRVYDFPGNIRELHHILSKAAINCHNELIREQDIDLSTTGYEPLLSKHHSLEQYIEEIEVREIKNALKQSGGNKTKAADLLGISFRALRYKIKKLEIED